MYQALSPLEEPRCHNSRSAIPLTPFADRQMKRGLWQRRSRKRTQYPIFRSLQLRWNARPVPFSRKPAPEDTTGEQDKSPFNSADLEVGGSSPSNCTIF